MIGERMHRCYAKWGPQEIDWFTGRLTPESWDCDVRNLVDEPCQKYSTKKSWVLVLGYIFLGLCAGRVLVALIDIFFPWSPTMRIRDNKENQPPVEIQPPGRWLPIWFLAAGVLLVLAKFFRGD